MAARTWPLLIGLLLLTSGCLGLGGVEPAHVPSEDLPPGWSEDDRSTREIAYGLGELEMIRYSRGNPTAGAAVATLNDVPLLDERSRAVPAAISQIENNYGVTLQESGSTSVQLTNQGGQAEATLYDVQGAPGGADAKALMFTVDCDPFVLVLGFGITEDTPFNEPRYDEAKRAATAVVCPG